MPQLRPAAPRLAGRALTGPWVVLAQLLPATLLAATVGLDLPDSAPAPARETRLVMGTTAEVWVADVEAPARAFDAAFAALDAVDQALSLWKESELVALNRNGEALLSPLAFETLRHALDVAQASDGAFDPTLEPLLRARGLYEGRARHLGAEETRRLLQRVGFRRVSLDGATRRVRLQPGSALDLGGIAKGYAVDLALRALRERGVRRALVDLGTSSLGVIGETLTVDVADPLVAGQAPWAHFDVRDACVSSSGTAQRGAHILDPRTGAPARRVLGATVVAPLGVEADALSTALFVLGADPGLALVERRGASGFVLLREHGRSMLRATPGFRERYALEGAPGVRVREEAR